MKTLCKLLSLLLLASAGAYCQSAITGTLTAQSTTCNVGQSCVVLSNLTTGNSSSGGATIGVSGTFSATTIVEVSNDNGKTWNTWTATDGTTTGFTAQGLAQWNVAGMTNIRLRCSAFTSGTVTVTIQSGAVAARAGGSGGGGGSGTVTTFTAGALSPLFTTSVANPTVTPALSFSLTNAAAGTIFGNLTTGSGSPSFTSFSISGAKCYLFTGTGGQGCDAGTLTGSGTPLVNQIATFVDANTVAGSADFTITPGTHTLAGGSSGIMDLSVLGGLVVPSGAGFAATAALMLGYDSNTGTFQKWNGTVSTSIPGILPSGSFQSGYLTCGTGTTPSYTLDDCSAAGGTPILATNVAQISNIATMPNVIGFLGQQAINNPPTLVTALPTNMGNTCTEPGTDAANILTCTTAFPYTTSISLDEVRIKTAQTTTGAATLNVNGLGAVSITDTSGNALSSTVTLHTGGIYACRYNSTTPAWQCVPTGTGGGGGGSSAPVWNPPVYVVQGTGTSLGGACNPIAACPQPLSTGIATGSATQPAVYGAPFPISTKSSQWLEWHKVMEPAYIANASGQMTFQWYVDTATSGNVGWDVNFKCAAINAPIQPTYTAVQTAAAVAVTGTINQIQQSTITPTVTCAAGQSMWMRVLLDSSNTTATGGNVVLTDVQWVE